MPNWCFNRLTVEGPEAEVDTFAEQVTGESALDFEKILPTPEEMFEPKEAASGEETLSGAIMELMGQREPSDWYSWRVQNWGTKWPADGEAMEVNEEPAGEGRKRRTYIFDTAWSPPGPLCDYLAEQYPQLEFRLVYYEQGNCLAGVATWKDGELVDMEDYEDDPEACRQLIERELGDGHWID